MKVGMNENAFEESITHVCELMAEETGHKSNDLWFYCSKYKLIKRNNASFGVLIQ